jgi:hypothetical protein
MSGDDFLHETAAVIHAGWCSGADARDSSGRAVELHDREGLVAHRRSRPRLRATRRHSGRLGDALWGISGVIPDWSLDAWNNVAGRNQAETLEMLADASTSLAGRPPPAALQ